MSAAVGGFVSTRRVVIGFLCGVAIAAALILVAGRPPSTVLLRARVMGLDPSATAVLVASRGDCADAEREGPRWAQLRVPGSGRLEVPLHRAASGLGWVCVFEADPRGGSRRWGRVAVDPSDAADGSVEVEVEVADAPVHPGPRARR